MPVGFSILSWNIKDGGRKSQVSYLQAIISRCNPDICVFPEFTKPISPKVSPKGYKPDSSISDVLESLKYAPLPHTVSHVTEKQNRRHLGALYRRKDSLHMSVHEGHGDTRGRGHGNYLIALGSKEIHLYGVHFFHDDAEELIESFLERMSKHTDKTWIAIGDFNLPFNEVAALAQAKGIGNAIPYLRPVGRNAVQEPEHVELNETHTYLNDGKANRLDYLLFSDVTACGLSLVELYHFSDWLNEDTSDHLPILAKFRLP